MMVPNYKDILILILLSVCGKQLFCSVFKGSISFCDSGSIPPKKVAVEQTQTGTGTGTYMNVNMEATTYKLPPLPYAYDALEPSISRKIMELHHSKHHQTYVTNLNAALESQITAIKSNDIPQQIANLQAIKFNGGGHINHSLFWHNLAPANDKASDRTSAPKLMEAIKQHWGSWEEFQDRFSKTLLGIQGSGWGWLVKNSEDGRLAIVTTKDQDPVEAVYTPILGIDMWEHAFYLDYLNVKPKYVENIWKVLNLKTAEERFLGTRPDAFKVLKASM